MTFSGCDGFGQPEKLSRPPASSPRKILHPKMETHTMPPVSKAQQRFMGAELARKRAGKATQTGMSEKQLEEFAAKPKAKKLPTRKK